MELDKMKCSMNCRFYFGNLILILIFFGCAGGEKVKRPSRETESIINFEVMNEDFDPVILNDDNITIEEAEDIHNSFEDRLLAQEESLEDSVVTGYRVQLIQTSDPEEAKNAERDAILRFTEEVYRVFDTPFYKVRVGDFVNWYDAQKLQKLAMQKGFREAWVIRTKINLKKAYKWLDEL